METIEFGPQTPAEQVVESETLAIRLPERPVRFYRHGWQSWSLAAWTDTDALLPVSRPYLLLPMQHDPAHAARLGHHGSWVGAVELGSGEIVLLGSLGLEARVSLDGNELVGNYESGSGPWLIARGHEKAVFSNYAAKLGQLLVVRPERPVPAVWCSWYGLYTAIDEKLLGRVVRQLAGLPFDVIQVDDGWQSATGDWEVNGKFPSGMQALADAIRSTGRKAGLWLAPLIAVRTSRLFEEHRDWFLRDETGRLVPAGFNWGQRLYALDTSQPAVLEWLAALMRRVRGWGYDYIKLDFLYGGALPGVRRSFHTTPSSLREAPPERSAGGPQMPGGSSTSQNAQADIWGRWRSRWGSDAGPEWGGRESAYRQGLQALRDGMGDDAYLVGCGAPILPSLGLCDALRIGPDVAGHWESQRDAVLLHNPAAPGTRNAIRTVLHRLWLKPLVQPDPDVVYFRSVDCDLTDEQKHLLQSLALICGFKATSDLPGWLADSERLQLRRFLEASPRVEQSGARDFSIDGQPLDYRLALELPAAPAGWEAVQSAALSWIADHRWALRIDHEINRWLLDRKLRSMRDKL